MGENIEKILSEEQIKELEKKRKKQEKIKEKKLAKWYTAKVNSNIYVTNLPKQITETELVEYFTRCGFIRKDPKTNEYKVKLYKDPEGKPKGDALVSFLREESVTMAIELLNETEIRPGYKINVQRASFNQKGDYQSREQYKLDELQKIKFKSEINRMLGWNEEDDERGLRIVILKYMFVPSDFYEDSFREDLEMDIIEEVENKFGEIDKFKIFDEHPEGVVKIKFKLPISAEKCIEGLNGRWYNGLKVEAAFWDGKTDYSKYNEDTQSQDKRIVEFGNWLEDQESKTENLDKATEENK